MPKYTCDDVVCLMVSIRSYDLYIQYFYTEMGTTPRKHYHMKKSDSKIAKTKANVNTHCTILRICIEIKPVQ